jgi:hypothetical protein
MALGTVSQLVIAAADGASNEAAETGEHLERMCISIF